MITTLHLSIGSSEVRAEARRFRRTVWCGLASYEAPGELPDLLARLAAEPALRGVRRVRARAEVPIVQLRNLEGLPPVTGRALRALVAAQATRFFRKNGSPLAVDAVWRERGRAALRARLRRTPRAAIAAAIEEPWLDAIATGVRGAGWRLDSVEAPDDDRRLRLRLPADRRLARERDFGALRRLAGVAFALWLAVGAYAVARVERAHARIDAELVRLAKPVAAAALARRQVAEAGAMIEAMDQERRRQGAMTRRIAGVVVALPDSAFYTSLSIDEADEGLVTGLALHAAEVLAALERTDAVSAPRFEGTPVRETVGGRELERFTIRFGRTEVPDDRP
jgi:hypothetical protein